MNVRRSETLEEIFEKTHERVPRGASEGSLETSRRTTEIVLYQLLKKSRRKSGKNDSPTFSFSPRREVPSETERIEQGPARSTMFNSGDNPMRSRLK